MLRKGLQARRATRARAQFSRNCARIRPPRTGTDLFHLPSCPQTTNSTEFVFEVGMPGKDPHGNVVGENTFVVFFISAVQSFDFADSQNGQSCLLNIRNMSCVSLLAVFDKMTLYTFRRAKPKLQNPIIITENNPLALGNDRNNSHLCLERYRNKARNREPSIYQLAQRFTLSPRLHRSMMSCRIYVCA